jgi:hypothetical protein
VQALVFRQRTVERERGATVSALKWFLTRVNCQEVSESMRFEQLWKGWRNTSSKTYRACVW